MIICTVYMIFCALIAFGIIRTLFRFVKRVVTLFKLQRRNEAWKLLTKGALVLGLIAVGLYFVKAILIGVVCVVMFLLGLSRDGDTVYVVNQHD